MDRFRYVLSGFFKISLRQRYVRRDKQIQKLVGLADGRKRWIGLDISSRVFVRLGGSSRMQKEMDRFRHVLLGLCSDMQQEMDRSKSLQGLAEGRKRWIDLDMFSEVFVGLAEGRGMQEEIDRFRYVLSDFSTIRQRQLYVGRDGQIQIFVGLAEGRDMQEEMDRFRYVLSGFCRIS